MKRANRWIVAGLVLALPGLGQADELEVPPYAAVPPCLETADNPVVGTIVAVTGAVTIAVPHCAPVPAECGSLVRAGERVTTGPGAQVALLADGRYVQLGADSRVGLDADASGATRVAVEQGSARVIEVGAEPGAALAVATPALETRDPGADVVASVAAPGVSSICSWADPIDVREGDRVTAVPAGSCVGAGASARPEVVATAAGGSSLPISIASVGRCDVAAGTLPPTDVASGPPGSPIPPTPPPLPPPTYCQGGACLPIPPPQPPPPPVVACCPGGIGEQPVIFEPPPD